MNENDDENDMKRLHNMQDILNDKDMNGDDRRDMFFNQCL